MKRTKQLVFAIALTFLAGLFWSAQAQVIPPSKAITIQGIEISSGIAESDKDEVYGCSWLGKTSGSFPGSFFMSMNYTQSSNALSGPQPYLLDIVTSGTWSLPVYANNRYLGAIYGHVVSGTMEWQDLSKSFAAVNMTLFIDGGTKNFAGISGKGIFSGTLNRATKGMPELKGTLAF